MNNGSKKKHIMWYKINELNGLGLNKSQISRTLQVDRGTVRKYLLMNEEEFLSSTSYKRSFVSALDAYEHKILSYLDFCQDMSSSQIHDRLREDYADFPKFHNNTIFNYVRRLRDGHNLPKKDLRIRTFSKLDETPYGRYAQVDFGEKWICAGDKRQYKVYFMVMVLSRSRYKFVYLQRTPFTTLSSIYAHELAFEYFNGIPQEIIYDQDRVFIKNENLGDYLLTNDFKRFVDAHHFKVTFCRKSDPQSKGKVENVVKYVKYNFLKGRPFTDIATLNKDVLSWLSRTANGLTHKGTQLIPSAVYTEEKEYLTPYNGQPTKVEEIMKEYLVRRDNTINYRSNFYTLPLGTYKGADTKVYLSIDSSQIHLYSKESGKIITSHKISRDRGKLISHPDHRLRDRTTIKELEKMVISYLGDREEVKLYLSTISNNKSRYYLDSLRHLDKHLNRYSVDDILDVIINHTNNNIFNCNHLVRDLDNRSSTQSVNDHKPYVNDHFNSSDITPEKRDINQYNSVI